MTTNSPTGSLTRAARDGSSEGLTFSLGDLPDRDEVTGRVHDQYAVHPFPPPQRKHSYRGHAAYVRSFLEGIGRDPARWRFGDIACGTGLMMLDYALEFPEASFVGYDLSETSVDRANEMLRREGVDNAEAAVANLLEIEETESFDYILSWGTVHHLADPFQGISVLCRALKPGGVLRLGVYGHYGNFERKLQQEIMETVGGHLPLEERISLVRTWAEVDPRFVGAQTAPPVDLDDDDWVVDEFLHAWEQPLKLGEVVGCLGSSGLAAVVLTDYYDEPISLDPARYLPPGPLSELAAGLPFEQQCHLVDLLARPYWLSVLAVKQSGGDLSSPGEG